RSGPLMVGIAQSVMTRSMASPASFASADSPSCASTMASNPIVVRWLLMIRRIVAESSITRILIRLASLARKVQESNQRLKPGHQAERVGEVDHRACALHPAHHLEVRLVAVEVRGEHDDGLVEARGRAENVARERKGRRQDRAVAGEVASVQGMKRSGRGRGD